MKHNATTGFQDIKALPSFTESSLISYWPYFVALLLIIFISKKLLSKIYSAVKGKHKQLSLYEQCKLSLENLHKKLSENEINARIFSSECSLVLREVIQKHYELPAKDLTNTEIMNSLTQSKKNDISLLPEIKKILFSLEEIAFSKRNIKAHSEKICGKILELTLALEKSAISEEE